MIRPSLTNAETVAGELRALFESRGFCRTTPGKFEDYNLYVENRNFLDCEHVITFMNMDGNLLALKPDVTLSIVKNMPDGVMPEFEKLYYLDEVYRVSHERRDYKAVSQIGVELIGPPDPLSNIEAVDLALEALSLIHAEFVLDISHLGFVSGMFDSVKLANVIKTDLMNAIHAKSIYEVRSILERVKTDAKDVADILALADLHGPLHKTLPRIKALCRNDVMRDAYSELFRLNDVICKNEMADHVFFDVSVMSDLDYYNGLLLVGYVKDVPKAILSGGRYDNLLRRIGKKSDAIGFAISLSELNIYQRGARAQDFDVLIAYHARCDYALLLAEQKRIAAQGCTVRLEPDFGVELASELRHEFGSGPRTGPNVFSKAVPGSGFSCGRKYRFTKENELEEVPPC